MFLEDEDKNFWLETVKDVKESKPINIIIKEKNPKIEIKEHRQFAVKQEFTTYSKYFDNNKPEGIDKATLRKFKREEFKIEATLDLHGFTEDDAFIKVDNFIPQCYNQGKRCVVIITGKGLTVREDDDIFTPKGILKRQVPQWLDMPRIRSMILIYKHPSEKLGGSGSLYILLKRNKNILI
ncbi:MAG: Smr/MutS family protein [Alphaproteobacteria bacterium]|nr:Smr/MutS family protein [Alphaproteobacteria bacterium]